MGKNNKSNIQESEILSEEVQKYQCLYDKADMGYKEKDRRANAWRTVDEALGYEEGTASNQFDTLKKTL